MCEHSAEDKAASCSPAPSSDMRPLWVTTSLQLSQIQGLTTPQGPQGRMQCRVRGRGQGHSSAHLSDGHTAEWGSRWLGEGKYQPLPLE